jgi:hypothetical protein
MAHIMARDHDSAARQYVVMGHVDGSGFARRIFTLRHWSSSQNWTQRPAMLSWGDLRNDLGGHVPKNLRYLTRNAAILIIRQDTQGGDSIARKGGTMYQRAGGHCHAVARSKSRCQ